MKLTKINNTSTIYAILMYNKLLAFEHALTYMLKGSSIF